MSKVKIETLTSLHIGSGETLQYGSDFVCGNIDGNDFIGIIEPRRILSLIGEEHISNWVSAIDRKESTDSIVKLYSPKSGIDCYSKRLILDWAGVKSTDTLKEFIHDGMGKPYIPGSSIKGAIRTAVLATLANERDNFQSRIQDRGRVSARQVESLLFGKDPNSDVFRFLLVGDAVFGNEYEVAVRMVNINERPVRGFWDKSKQQVIEAIASEDSSVFQIKIASEYFDYCNKHWPVSAKNPLGKLPGEMQTLSSLFSLINAHTKGLVESEIEYWNNLIDQDTSDRVSDYIGKMKDILTSINQCVEGKECVLRIGHGSGWRFMTGAWTEGFDNFETVVVPASRPHNDRYSDFSFPKSRRVDDTCELLGFVKLSLL